MKKWIGLVVLVAAGCAPDGSRVDALAAELATAKQAAEDAAREASRVEQEHRAAVKQLTDRLAAFEANMRRDVEQWKADRQAAGEAIAEAAVADEQERLLIELGALDEEQAAMVTNAAKRLRNGEKLNGRELRALTQLAPSFLADERRAAYIERGKQLYTKVMGEKVIAEQPPTPAFDF